MENANNINSAKTGLLGFLVGATVGAMVGVLFAPKSGEETRKLIADKTNETLRRTQETLEAQQQRIEQKLADAKEALLRLQEQVAEKGAELKTLKVTNEAVDTEQSEQIAMLEERINNLERQLTATKKTTKKRVPAKKK